MASVPELIATRLSGDPDRVWTPADFADLASRSTIDKALQRLTNEGRLRRIDRGLYDSPTFNRLTGKPSVPNPRAVIDAIAKRDQLRVIVDGMTAANELGLTDAVPAKVIAHTERRLKPIELGKMKIEFKPTTTSKLFWAGRPAMRLVQALHWLRDILARPGERANLEAKISRILIDSRGRDSLTTDLLAGWSALPGWMQDFLRPLMSTDLLGQGRHTPWHAALVRPPRRATRRRAARVAPLL